MIMPPPVFVFYRLYLKQIELNKEHGVLEVVPVTFNYQNFIVVATNNIPTDGGMVVYQTHSCGCGPQPLIRAGRLLRVLPWPQAALRRAMAESDNAKDQELADQDLVPEVYLVAVDDREEIVQAVTGQWGRDVRVRFFGEI